MKRAELQAIIQSAAEESLSACDCGENPLEAWAKFVDRLDSAGRRAIGDRLAVDGLNRYTGRRQHNGNN